MKKKILLIPLILLLAMSLAITGCPAPAPEITKIEILAGRPGDSWTVLSEALATFINEDSEWLRASAVATGGVGDTVKILLAEPERRATATALGWLLEARPKREETGFYPLLIGKIASFPFLWVTYDKNIKSLEDFAGKVVGSPREVPHYWDFFKGTLEDAGVLDKIKVVHAGLGGNKTALIDGTVDITFTTFTIISPEKMLPGKFITEMEMRKPLYFIDYTKERLDRVAQKQGVPPVVVEVPPKTLGPTQEKTIYVFAQSYWWGAGLEMSEDIVYEITRIMYERASKVDFLRYHAQGEAMTTDFIPYGDWTTREEIEYWYHPGALKFYREVGVPGL